MTNSTPHDTAQHTESKRPWQRPAVQPMGTLGDVLKSGSNKATVVGDPAEPGKVPGPDL